MLGQVVAENDGPWWWQTVKVLFAIVAFFGLGATTTFLIWFRDGIWFLRKTRYREAGKWRALPAIATDLLSIVRLKGPWVTNETVQRMVEFELLKPKPDKKKDIEAWHTSRTNFLSLEEPVIEYDTCFPLHEVIEEIEKYAESLAKLRSQVRPKGFSTDIISSVTIKDGYYSPLYLLAGLLPKFSKDWPRVIAKYGEVMYDQVNLNMPASVQTQLCGRQLYQFFCWLIWGPSVPMCSTHWNDAPALQYGYGDEDNSVLLKVPQDHFAQFINGAGAADEIGTPLANRLGVTGRIRTKSTWPTTSFASPQQAGALSMHAAPNGESSTSDGVGARVIIDYQKECIPQQDNQFKYQRYYGAYLWVMLWICEEKRNGGIVTYDEVWRGDERWRNLLPYFVHGNLAEKTSYEHVCWLVASATAQAVRDLSRIADSNIRFAYVAAVDDSNCGGTLLVHERQMSKILHKLWDLKAPRDSSGVETPDVSLRRLLLPSVPEINRRNGLEEVLRFQAEKNKPGTPIHGCHLSSIVAEFAAKLPP